MTVPRRRADNTPQRVLGVFAELTKAHAATPMLRVDTSTFRWLPSSYVDLMRGKSGLRGHSPDEDGFPDDALTDRILRTARVIADPGALRVGWLWVVGTSGTDTVLFPLASVAARVPSLHGVKNLANRIVLSGDKWADVEAITEPELTELIADRSDRERLGDIPLGRPRYRTDSDPGESRRQIVRSQKKYFDEVTKWAAAASDAAGYPATDTISTDVPLSEMLTGPARIVVAVGLYVQPSETQTTTVTASGTLQQWADNALGETAFAHIYGDTPASVATVDSTEAAHIATPLRLDPSQRAVVASSVRQPLTVVSGPPGTGKSQTVVATAYHQVQLGNSVLIAAPTDAAVSAIVELIESTPGPEPIVFGNSTHRLEIANRLADGGGDWFSDAEVEQRRQEFDLERRNNERLTRAIASLLETERSSATDPANLLVARQEAPGFFDIDADLTYLDERRSTAYRRSGWFAKWRARRAFREFAAAARGLDDLELSRLSELLDLAVARREAAELEAAGGLDVSDVWPGLIAADDTVRDRAGRALEAETHHDERADRSSRRAINAVATALRAGRSRRRQLLANVRGDELIDALPLWVASVRDIDDLLPMTPGLFDVVIIDEASHLDQIGAAPALLRGRNAVIAGDPRQLRHVSFVSDERMRAALTEQTLDGTDVANQLDLRRQSAFDAAAAVAPVAMLTEHYRSAPHLIDFSSRHFYDGRVSVATRHPRNERDDRIAVIDGNGSRNADGVNTTEVAQVLELLATDLERARDTHQAQSIGVISPFRAQADAIQAAVVDQFSYDAIDLLNLRVGTVHSFQGCQRDVIYVSLAIDDDSPPGSRAFLSEASLFNVMITRAKEEMTLLISATRPDTGILADYLRHADEPAISAPAPTSLSRWAATVREELTRADLQTAAGYRAGRHTIDLVLGTGEHAVGVICGVHPGGADAHIDRHLSLRRRGWNLIEVFESRWADQLPQLAIELSSNAD